MLVLPAKKTADATSETADFGTINKKKIYDYDVTQTWKQHILYVYVRNERQEQRNAVSAFY